LSKNILRLFMISVGFRRPSWHVPHWQYAAQAGTFALVPQVADAVKIPVIAAGGIADGRGIAAAFALGASAVQVGTAYLFCPEAKVSALHRKALQSAQDDETAVTNVFTGRPARGIINRAMRELGPLSADSPAFPLAGGALAPLKAAAEAKGDSGFTSLWSGQARPQRLAARWRPESSPKRSQLRHSSA
jgi:nitronate monooxygenase